MRKKLTPIINIFISLLLSTTLLASEQHQSFEFYDASAGTTRMMIEMGTGIVLFNFGYLLREVELDAPRSFNAADTYCIKKTVINSIAMLGMMGYLNSYNEPSQGNEHFVNAVAGATLTGAYYLALAPLRKCFATSRFNFLKPTLNQITSFETDCSICREPLDTMAENGSFQKNSHFLCGHHLHTECYELLKGSVPHATTLCPLCRKELVSVRGE